MKRAKKYYYCYLLHSTTSKTRTYIGYTIDPKRRLRQHNGEITGGAKYTRGWRPWHHKLVVSGFKTSTEALQFEWAWKHPCRSRFLKGVRGRSTKDRVKVCRLLMKHFITKGTLKLRVYWKKKNRFIYHVFALTKVPHLCFHHTLQNCHLSAIYNTQIP